MIVVRNWRQPVDHVHLGTGFGVVDAAHPNGHRGCDFNGLPEGTPLKAICNGMTVVNVLFSKVLGNIIVLQVGDKFFGYCHMQKPAALKVGAKVNSGDVVGLLGTTGTASSGPHLHLTLGWDKFSAITGNVSDAYHFLVTKIEEEKVA